MVVHYRCTTNTLDGALPRIQLVQWIRTQFSYINTGFPTAGTIAIGNELITIHIRSAHNRYYRGAKGTATWYIHGQAHSDRALVTNATDFTGWGMQ